MMLLNFVHCVLLRSVDTALVRAAARVFAIALLFLVLCGAVARGADEPDAHAQPAAEEIGDAHAAAAEPDETATTAAGQPDHLPTAAEAAAAEQIETSTAEGVAMWMAGKHEEAERSFATALSVDAPPASKRALMLQLATIYEQADESLKAISVLEKFHACFPTDRETPQTLLRLGVLYRKTGAYGTATARFFQVLNSTLRLAPEDLDMYRRMAMKARLEIADTFAAQGEFAEAQKYFSRLQLLELEPADRERVRFRGAQLQHALRQWSAAEVALRDFVQEYPESAYTAEARYLRAKALNELGRRDEATAEVLELLRSKELSDPVDYREAAYWKSRTGNEVANQFYERGDFLGALSIYQALAGASAEPAWQWPAVYQIGLCFERLNLPERAAEAYETIVKPDPPVTAEAKLPEALVSLQGMAKWRLEHLDWIEQFEKQRQSLTSASPADHEQS